MEFKYQDIQLQSFTQNDFPLLKTWLKNPEVGDLLGVENDLPDNDVCSLYPVNQWEAPYLIIYNDRKIGFLYLEGFDSEQNIRHHLDLTAYSLAIDMAIAEPALQNKGLGQKALEALIQWVKQRYQPDLLVLDTLPWHEQAIACYKKCGFEEWDLLKKHEFRNGAWIDNILMGIDFRKQSISNPLI